jgi:hypothetical protein
VIITGFFLFSFGIYHLASLVFAPLPLLTFSAPLPIAIGTPKGG